MLSNSRSRRGTSSLTMVLLLMTLTSSLLMFYWFQRCRAMEDRVAAWEFYDANGGEKPSANSPWGRLSLSSVGTSTAEAIRNAPIALAGGPLTRPADVVEKARAQMEAEASRIAEATEAAARKAAADAAIPLAQRVLGDLTPNYPASETQPASTPEATTHSSPAADPAPVAVEPAHTEVASQAVLPTPNPNMIQNGVRRDPGPGADIALPPIADSTQAAAQPAATLNGMDMVSAETLEAAPTPAPRRSTRIRSVYDLEPQPAAPTGSRPRATAPDQRTNRQSASNPTSPFAPRRNRNSASSPTATSQP